MKNFILNSKKALTFCFLLACTFTFAQTTVNNTPDTSADFTDLQAAIDAATNGDIIYVQQSATTYGTIIIDKELTIIGRSHADTGYKTTVGNVNFADGSSNTTLKGLKIGGISYSGSGGTITDLKFFDNDISSFNLNTTHTYNNVLIQGNVMRSTFSIPANMSNTLVTNNIFFSSSLSFANPTSTLFSNNIMAYYNGPSFNNNSTGLLNIDNCIFIGNSTNGNKTVNLYPNSGTIQVNNCVTYNYDAATTYTFATGAGITINANNQENVDPLFTNVDIVNTPSIASPYNTTVYDPANDDLTLQGGSPVNDDGLFQGYNFKNFGIPTGYPSMKIDSYSSTVPKNSDLTVTITAKTN